MRYLVLSIALAGCASAPPRQPPQPIDPDQLQAAMAEYMNCLLPYAKRFDDGLSDAGTIAAAVKDTCPENARVVLGIMARSMENDNQRALLAQRFSRERFDIARQVVLQYRASKPK